MLIVETLCFTKRFALIEFTICYICNEYDCALSAELDLAYFYVASISFASEAQHLHLVEDLLRQPPLWLVEARLRPRRHLAVYSASPAQCI